MNLAAQVRVPTVVLHAASNPVVRWGTGALAAAIPGARLVEVLGEGHALLFGGRLVLARELTVLLDRADLHAGAPLT